MSWKSRSSTLKMTCVSASLFACAYLRAVPITGGSTTFTPSAQVLQLANGFGVSASIIPPATGNFDSNPPVFVLPIIGGDTTTEIDYGGGISVNAGPFGAYSLTNFVGHLAGANANTLTADVTDSDHVDRAFTLADFNASNEFTVDPQAAKVLQELTGFDANGLLIATGVTQLELESTAAPEPAELGLIGLGLAGFATLTMKRRKQTQA